jgi:hypothetical protein
MHTVETKKKSLLLLGIKPQSFSRPAYSMITIPIMSWEILHLLSTLFCSLFLGLQHYKKTGNLIFWNTKREKETWREGKKRERNKERTGERKEKKEGT